MVNGGLLASEQAQKNRPSMMRAVFVASIASALGRFVQIKGVVQRLNRQFHVLAIHKHRDLDL
ncbi:hypothetical protein SAMN04488044_3138 [Cognatishimia maritima]|uniref:Uncharacterized protein n=1 Tax=Cognatishimia maritima TaxID=870908 RepID=A0A1M5VET3_9RHOB|nr:hypothetical protein SAMN04488044_3138 [Cognatishimia maritima]